jgi:putative two-component system response regulator
METPWAYLLHPKTVVPIGALLVALQHRHDPDIIAHAGRVATQAARIALDLQMPTALIEEAILVGWLHEINRPLDDHRDLIHSVAHTQASEHLLRRLPGLVAVSRSVRCLSERWDGLGGPDGLWDTQIPLSARIVAVADALDGLLHGTPHRGSVTPALAGEWLQRESGRRFDPAVVTVALATMTESGSDVAGLAVAGA